MLGVRALLSGGLPALVRVSGALLRVLAVDVDSRHTRGIPAPFYVLSTVSIVLYMHTYHVSMYWFLFTHGRRDVLFSITLFSLGINSLIGIIKLFYMYINSKKIKELVSRYLQCDATVVPDSRMSKNVLATLKLVRRRAAIFWILIISNGILYVVQAVVTPGRHLLEDKQIIIGLEPMFESPNYEIAFVIESVSVFFIVYAPATITAFIVIIVGYNEAQMMALAQELLHLWDDAQQHYIKTIGGTTDDNPVQDFEITTARARSSRVHRDRVAERQIIINSFIKYKLVSIMKLHAINISLIKRVESLFQSAIAIEFVLLSVALTAELLGGLENTYMEVPFSMIQVSMDCITGQKLITSNKVFEEAVYGCNWENFDVSNKKLVVMMLQNAQKTLTLSAGHVANLSYSSLMSVVRSIYSAYTALHSTMNK